MRRLPAIHGVFYLASGAWPLLSLRSFERVTGPKADGWLVKTVGALISAVGVSLLVGARRAPNSGERVLATGVAAALGSASLYYALRGRISRVYLLDAAAEAALVVAWLASRSPTASEERRLQP